MSKSRQAVEYVQYRVTDKTPNTLGEHGHIQDGETGVGPVSDDVEDVVDSGLVDALEQMGHVEDVETVDLNDTDYSESDFGVNGVENGDSGSGDGGSDDFDARTYYERVAPVYDVLGAMEVYDSEYHTILLNDFIGWYETKQNTDQDQISDGWDKKARVRSINQWESVLDDVERSVYATTSYNTPESMQEFAPCRFVDGGEREWRDGNPTPEWADTVGYAVWGDIDLTKTGDMDDGERGFREIRCNDGLPDDVQDTIEQGIAAFVDEWADLYGSRDAVSALDSGGGVYVLGAPEATAPIHRQFDADAAARIMSELSDRETEYLRGAEERVYDRVDGAEDVFDPDWVNNVNRQYKAPLSVHAKEDAVTTPIDTDDVDYSLTRISDVDDDMVESATEWAETFTAPRHTDAVENLVSALWPEYMEERADWEAALTAWVEDEREAEREAERRKREAQKRREKRREEMGDIEGVPVTPIRQDVLDALEGLDGEDVAADTIVHRWTEDASGLRDTSGAGKKAFVPTWGTNSNGSATYVNLDKGTFVDTGDGTHGTVVEMALIADGNWAKGDIADGEDWARGVDLLRELGYEIPVYVPDAEASESDKTPFWAMRKAAVAFGVVDADEFEEKESDDGGTYLGFPDSATYNATLSALEDAGIEHGRERAEYGEVAEDTAGDDREIDERVEDLKPAVAQDVDLDYPVYDVDGETYEVHCVPTAHGEVTVYVVGEYGDVLGVCSGVEFAVSDGESGNDLASKDKVQPRVNTLIESSDGDLSGIDKDPLTGTLLEIGADMQGQEFIKEARGPVLESLIDRTKGNPVCYPYSGDGEDTYWEVEMEPDPREPSVGAREFSFTREQMNGGVGGFKDAYLGMFLKKIDMSDEAWAALTEHWTETHELKDMRVSDDEAAARDRFKSRVSGLDIYESNPEGAAEWDSTKPVGLYIEDYESRDTGEVRDVVVVGSSWANQWSKDHASEVDSLPSKLHGHGTLVESPNTARGFVRKHCGQKQVWVLNAAELDMEPEQDVIDMADIKEQEQAGDY